MSEHARPLVLVGPPNHRPCGIADYVRRLGQALLQAGPVHQVDYALALAGAQVLNPPAAAGHAEVTPPSARADYLVHYERSLVPHPGYLATLAAALHAHGSRLYVVPHEVYAQDPYAFPYDQVKGFGPWGDFKRWLYRRRHAEGFAEAALQRAGYHADGLFALNQVAADILRLKLGQASLPVRVIPHARLEPWAPSPAREANRPQGVRWLWGLTGFASASNDYETLFSALQALPGHGLVLFSGTSASGSPLRKKIEASLSQHGLDARVVWHGYVAEADWPRVLSQADGFVAPWKFRSASGSVFMALATGKPVLVSDLPLARELIAQGAGLITVPHAATAWIEAMRKVADGALRAPADAYPWSYAEVARAYRRALDEAGPALNS